MAVVGGSNLLLNPDMFLVLSNQQFLAQDGRCKSFDAKGDGYGRGEGFAAVVLKRVDDAIRDGDPIRAVIRGTGVSQDGKIKGITVPSAYAQAELIRSTYRSAGIGFRDTHYFEAHVHFPTYQTSCDHESLPARRVLERKQAIHWNSRQSQRP
jgi:acyl transferase domain-containing protein